MTLSCNIPELDEYPIRVWGSLEDECHFLSDVLTRLKILWQRGLEELMISAKGFCWTGRPLYAILAFRLCNWARLLEFTVLVCILVQLFFFITHDVYYENLPVGKKFSFMRNHLALKKLDHPCICERQINLNLWSEFCEASLLVISDYH